MGDDGDEQGKRGSTCLFVARQQNLQICLSNFEVTTKLTSKNQCSSLLKKLS